MIVDTPLRLLGREGSNFVFGETLEDAMEDLVEELRAYARDFFERASFYAETDRAGHAPWLLRFALAPPDRQLELLYEDSRVAAAS